jgi:hypothetical protein
MAKAWDGTPKKTDAEYLKDGRSEITAPRDAGEFEDGMKAQAKKNANRLKATDMKKSVKRQKNIKAKRKEMHPEMYKLTTSNNADAAKKFDRKMKINRLSKKSDAGMKDYNAEKKRKDNAVAALKVEINDQKKPERTDNQGTTDSEYRDSARRASRANAKAAKLANK